MHISSFFFIFAPTTILNFNLKLSVMHRKGYKLSFMLWVMLLSMLAWACQHTDDTDNISPLATQLGYSKQKPLIIGLDADYAPLEYVDANGTPQGYDVEFTRVLMQRLGIPFTYHPNSWENIAPDVLHGKVDLGMMIYSPYRKDSTNYSRAVFRLYYQVVYPKISDDERFDFRNLEGKRIAYMNSRPVGELLTSEGAVKFSVTNLDEAFCDLVDGKYDAVICYRYQARYLINLHKFENLMTDEISLPPREYCYVSHSKHLIDIIDRELLKMEQDGVTDDIYDIKSTFGSIKIPKWVWYLLASLAFASLIVINFIHRSSKKKLAQANAVLENNNKQLIQRNQELTEARERAMESDQMKAAFIQNMTHQIRTPLNIITGFAQVIHDEYQSISMDEMKMMVDKMIKNTNTITTIVNQLLEISLQQSSRHINKDDCVGCNDICREAMNTVVLEHPDSVKLELKSSVADSLCINTNKFYLLKALQELLANANKFTNEGSITIECEQKDADSISFSVTDTGLGIPETERERIFAKFYKLDEFSEGLGLGLTICQNTVQMLGGTLHLDQEYDKGSRFVIILPMK